MKYRSLSEYIDCVRLDTNLSIQATRIIPPIGPAADKYLWAAISECCEAQSHIISFTAPCVRRERRENIQRGSHLSLFFLMMIVLGEDVPRSRMNRIYTAVTGVTEISVDEILSHKCTEFCCNQFIFRQKFVPSANNFDCKGYAYEMFDKKEIEVCNIARFKLNHSEKSCYVMAFGVERMIMHWEEQTDVWKTAPFLHSADSQENHLQCDKKRRLAFKSYAEQFKAGSKFLDDYKENIIVQEGERLCCPETV